MGNPYYWAWFWLPVVWVVLARRLRRGAWVLVVVGLLVFPLVGWWLMVGAIDLAEDELRAAIAAQEHPSEELLRARTHDTGRVVARRAGWFHSGAWYVEVVFLVEGGAWALRRFRRPWREHPEEGAEQRGVGSRGRRARRPSRPAGNLALGAVAVVIVAATVLTAVDGPVQIAERTGTVVELRAADRGQFRVGCVQLVLELDPEPDAPSRRVQTRCVRQPRPVGVGERVVVAESRGRLTGRLRYAYRRPAAS